MCLSSESRDCQPATLASTSDSRRTSRSSPSTLISVPPYLEYRTSSPSATSSGTRWPLSSSLPSPTARTLPFWGFSFAVSGRTMPLTVVSSSSTALTIRRSPRGLSFITREPPLSRVTCESSLALGGWECQICAPFYEVRANRQGVVGTLRRRVPRRRRRAVADDRRRSAGSRWAARAGRRRRASVLRAADAPQAVLQVRRVLHDLREAHHGDGVLERHLAAVDLLEEVDQLVRAAELGVVVLDLARREVLDALDLDVVDHRVEQLLARRVLVAHGDEHELVLAVFVPLVPEPDRRRLAAPLHLVREDGRIEVEDLHRAAPYPFAARIDNARSIIARSPG